MTVTHTLDILTEWVQKDICPKIELKVPPDSELDADDSGYEYRRTSPTAFAMYVPAKDKLPPGVISPFPSICVRFTDGADNLASGMGTIGVQLCFSAWNPGVHGEDVILPNEQNALEPKKWTGAEADAYFRRSGEGWRDAWNMVDIALREIESVTNIGGLVIDRGVPVKFGPLTEQEAIPDFYPFWFAWVSFSIQYPITRRIRDVDKFL